MISRAAPLGPTSLRHSNFLSKPVVVRKKLLDVFQHMGAQVIEAVRAVMNTGIHDERDQPIIANPVAAPFLLAGFDGPHCTGF